MDLGQFFTILSGLSSIAVILGALFVIFQLRQNGRILEATLRQQKSDVSMSLLERITDESFPRRRKHMYDVLARFKASGYQDGFESAEDFEIRNFAYIYELMGLMAKHQLVDLEVLLETLQYIVVRDWQVFEPHVEFLKERYGVSFHPYANFQWLAREASRHYGPGGQPSDAPHEHSSTDMHAH